jgi:hypothetical protein
MPHLSGRTGTFAAKPGIGNDGRVANGGEKLSFREVCERDGWLDGTSGGFVSGVRVHVGADSLFCVGPDSAPAKAFEWISTYPHVTARRYY